MSFTQASRSALIFSTFASSRACSSGERDMWSISTRNTVRWILDWSCRSLTTWINGKMLLHPVLSFRGGWVEVRSQNTESSLGSCTP